MSYALAAPAKRGKILSGFCSTRTPEACANCPRYSQNGANATRIEYRGDTKRTVPNPVTFCRCECHDGQAVALTPEKGQELLSKEVNVIVTSDLSDEPGAATVLFGLAGINYQIDLTPAEQADLYEKLAVYIGHARKGRQKKKPPTVGGVSPKAVRAWAQAQGMDVPPLGRLPKAVVEAFTKAHGGIGAVHS